MLDRQMEKSQKSAEFMNETLSKSAVIEQESMQEALKTLKSH